MYGLKPINPINKILGRKIIKRDIVSKNKYSKAKDKNVQETYQTAAEDARDLCQNCGYMDYNENMQILKRRWPNMTSTDKKEIEEVFKRQGVKRR